MRKLFAQSFYNIGQTFLLNYEESTFTLKYLGHRFIEEQLDPKTTVDAKFGIIDGDTQFDKFQISERANKFIKILSSKLTENIIFKQTFDLEKLGIGGLDRELLKYS